MAQKKTVRPARGAAANKTAKEKAAPPAPPAGTEEVGNDTVKVDTEDFNVASDPEANGEVVDTPDPTQDAQNGAGTPENAEGGAKADSHEYIGADGTVATEEELTQVDDADEETEGKKFKGGKRYKPKDKRVVPPKGRVIPAGGDITFDGIDFGTHIVPTEDVFREVFQFNSRRPTYVLEIRAGSILPRTIYEAIEKED